MTRSSVRSVIVKSILPSTFMIAPDQGAQHELGNSIGLYTEMVRSLRSKRFLPGDTCSPLSGEPPRRDGGSLCVACFYTSLLCVLFCSFFFVSRDPPAAYPPQSCALDTEMQPFKGRVFKQPGASRALLSVSYSSCFVAKVLERNGLVGGVGH